MKNLRVNMDKWFDRLEENWLALPIRKQHKCILYFFLGYVLLTAGVIFKVWYDTRMSGNNMIIEHMENPGLKKKKSPATLQDTIYTIIKNKTYERKSE
ncbi:nitrogen regulatory IIA protein [Flavobacterium sp. TAB 87]|uniref:nitrogen regulatory IIA protein n=1 Tax=Flavobacterium sp. TAB 87 TaxID=1729581 RepID=UPI00076C3FC2|nr:nitrogen regulatory IIA protein [Flavobacterium sp. TAB 87]KVV15049.1 hypothetical protein AP058_01607 [Flavobacterium sp. TAB 87]